jgi:curved DNA-binding protein CbpA
MSGTLEDDYALLGLRVGANDDEAKLAYKRLSRQVHPDAGGTDALFTALRLAYERILAYEYIDEPLQDDEPDGEPETPIWGTDDSPSASRVASGAGRRPRSGKGQLVLLATGFWFCHQILESSAPSLLRGILSVSIAVGALTLIARGRGRQRA